MFVVGYVTVVNRRNRIVEAIFGHPQYRLLDDYDDIGTYSSWKEVKIGSRVGEIAATSTATSTLVNRLLNYP
ncbi:hypothetical protein OESDEN_10799 [Oesophagostomum dentatum]|uniref:Uncharacterized protein n=1 Tax=Oesophagostomum dentatum TaxID=61180 RepID=A0A0B1SWM5_OESDE|nr:hypothetical protein OESDEN_10799 [Oesophagostomum dentatum]